MWKPIIKDKTLIKAINNKTNEIFELIQNIQDSNCSLLDGQPGIILFLNYFSKLNKTESSNCETNIQLLYNYFQKPSSLNYSSGLAGILHVLSHLEKENFFDFNDNIKEFDQSIFQNYISNEDTLDFLHGSSGVILSLLEQKINPKYNYLFNNWLESIDKRKEQENNNIHLKWKINFRTEQKGYSFGLAHGVPSIIIILLKLYDRNKSIKVLDYLKKSICFLLDNKLDNNDVFYFPSTIINSHKDQGRLAWCYGDLGIAFSLFLYGQYFAEKKINNLAIEIFTKHTTKRDYEKYDVKDADFCHGSVGIAHIYARMYNYTNFEIFRETSEYWYKVTLRKAIHQTGLSGYKHTNGKNQDLTNEYGLLEGISGIGLSFISAISFIEPKWDKTFLLS